MYSNKCLSDNVFIINTTNYEFEFQSIFNVLKNHENIFILFSISLNAFKWCYYNKYNTHTHPHL